jgi:hypothetical protein
MFFVLGHLWGSWTKERRPARWLYVAFAVGFIVLGAFGLIRGDGLVVGISATFGAAAAGLAAFAPRLAGWTTKREDGK